VKWLRPIKIIIMELDYMDSIRMTRASDLILMAELLSVRLDMVAFGLMVIAVLLLLALIVMV
jgi:hypothetical protein